jgi:hypothetical protein
MYNCIFTTKVGKVGFTTFTTKVGIVINAASFADLLRNL